MAKLITGCYTCYGYWTIPKNLKILSVKENNNPKYQKNPVEGCWYIKWMVLYVLNSKGEWISIEADNDIDIYRYIE